MAESNERLKISSGFFCSFSRAWMVILFRESSPGSKASVTAGRPLAASRFTCSVTSNSYHAPDSPTTESVPSVSFCSGRVFHVRSSSVQFVGTTERTSTLAVPGSESWAKRRRIIFSAKEVFGGMANCRYASDAPERALVRSSIWIS